MTSLIEIHYLEQRGVEPFAKLDAHDVDGSVAKKDPSHQSRRLNDRELAGGLSGLKPFALRTPRNVTSKASIINTGLGALT